MSRIRPWLLLALFAKAFSICQSQTVVPDSLPELKYPPIARAAHVQGDVVVSFRQTPDGRTANVIPISGPAMLQGIAVENVKAWRFERKAGLAEQAYKVTFQFRLNPPNDGYDDSKPVTKAVLDGAGTNSGRFDRYDRIESFRMSKRQRSHASSNSDEWRFCRTATLERRS